MAPIVVEPDALAGAGASISGVSDELAAALSTLAAGLPNGAMAGNDRAGLAFGQAYQQAAQALMDAGGAAADGGRKVGFGVQMSATNYSRAEAFSTIGGGANVVAPPAPPGQFDAPTVPSPFGGGVAEPFLWSMVQMLVGDVWPDGDPAQLRAAAGAWSGFAGSLTGIGGELEGPSATISGQQIPEGGAMALALSQLKRGLSDIGTQSAKLATQTREFAADVESAQNAIRDLLSRLSPSGIFDALGAVFSGDAMDELREIAADIRAVLDNLKRQADARQQSMQDVMQMVDDAVVSLQHRARQEFTHYLGDDVGNATATAFDFQSNVSEGFLKGGFGALEDIQQLNPLRFAYDFEGAKDTWGAMLETNFNASPAGAIIDPQRALDTQTEMLKGLVHAEDWTTDRSGLGLGENLFDAGSALLGGAGAARAGTRAAGEAADAAEGAVPGVRAAGALDSTISETSSIAGRVEGIADDLENVGDDIPTGATPNATGPAIPHDLVESPTGPHVPDAPTHSGSEHPGANEAPNPADSPNNPAHTGLHDPPANHATPGDRLPDLTDINDEYRRPDGAVDPNRFHEWAEKVADAYPTITSDGVEGVYNYTTEKYDAINPYLRDIDPLSPEQRSMLGAPSISDMSEAQRASVEAQIKQTDEGLAALPPYRADPADLSSTTWRGIQASDSFLDQLKLGDTFSDAGYLSTTSNPHVAEAFARANPSATPTLLSVIGRDGVDVKDLSRYMDESEILFPRSTQFEVAFREMGDDGLLRITLRQIDP